MGLWMDDPENLHYRLQFARWALRGFYLLFAVGAVVIVGYAMVPSLSSLAGPLSLLLWAAAMFCVLIACGYLARYLIARRSQRRKGLITYRGTYPWDREWKPPRIGWKAGIAVLGAFVFFAELKPMLQFLFDHFGNIVGALALMALLGLGLLYVLSRPPHRPHQE